jgi:hypothetical protein
MAERMDPEMTAYVFSEHVQDTEKLPGAYLRGFLDELLNLEPGLRQYVSDLVVGDLKEEISRDDTDFARAVHNAIVSIETK